MLTVLIKNAFFHTIPNVKKYNSALFDEELGTFR